LSYLLQAGRGQMELFNRARPLSEVIKDERTAPRIRELLGRIPDIKAFGEAHGLKPTHNYTEYVALDRAAAVWVVSACEPLRFKSKEWGFPVVGRFPYLGWFDLEAAREFAAELRKEKEGWDVDVRGAGAYSTLGWFRDAILSTMIPAGPEALGDLVNVILHESTHATVYVASQAYFNESVANFAGDKLTRDYLEERLGKGAMEKAAYEKVVAAGEERGKRMREAYDELSALYASAKPDEQKKADKARILAELKKAIGAKRELNNATLVQYKTYHVGREDFEAVFRACAESWPRFWKAMHRLEKGYFKKPQQEDLASVLLPLAKEGCPE
jgi:predicted aminopeptidase